MQASDIPVITDDWTEEVDEMSGIFSPRHDPTPVVDDVHVHSFEQDDHLEGYWDGEVYVLEDDSLSEVDWDSWDFE